uniref:Uncharacterized protein n=1 Tax=viral metagenome TaxID=1070528 RepID=A0A6H1ZE16_9ZZZZ
MEAYKITFPGWLCQRCGHKWPKLKPATPIVCSHCRSPYWKTKRGGAVYPTKIPTESKIEIPIPKSEEVLIEIPVHTANMYFTDVKPIEVKKLHISDEVVKHFQDKTISVSTPPHIPQKDITPDNENTVERECFVCAQERQFECVNHELKEAAKDICNYCFGAAFWLQRDMFKDILDMQPPEPEIQFAPTKDPDSKEEYKREAYACKLKVKYPDGMIVCPNKDRARIVKPACPLCWELEELWHELAAGYRERRGLK